MKFEVIDTKTNKAPDLRQIALTEEWAKPLVYCDLDCFALDQDGLLMLFDACGNYVYCPGDRFKVIIKEEK